MSNLNKRILFIIATIFLMFMVSACGKSIKIEITGDSEMVVGKEQTLTATITPDDTNQDVTWESSNPDIATIDEEGVVVAITEGIVSITATSVDFPKISKSFTITISSKDTVDLESITINGDTEMGIGEEQSLTITGEPADADVGVSWKSANTKIATVDENGHVVAIAEGTVEITATSIDYPEVSSSITISVTKAKVSLESITISGSSEMEAGSEQQLTVTGVPADAEVLVSWKSSDTKVATVDNKGLVVAIAEGTVEITATSEKDSKITDTFTITVRPEQGNELESITIQGATEMDVNKQQQLSVEGTPSNIDFTVEWSVSDSTIVSVSTNGLVTALKTGTVTVTAKVKNNSSIFAEINITIVEPSYKLSYVLNGGENNPENVSSYVKEDDVIVLHDPERAGYEFLGWFTDQTMSGLPTNKIDPRLVMDITLYAKWEKALEADEYRITYISEKGGWATRDAASRQEIVDALFTDYYNWAKAYADYTGSYESFIKGSDGKYQSGYWYTQINDKMRNESSREVDESGENRYFYNTPEYYYKWTPFFEAFDVAMLQVNPAQSFFTDTFAAMVRMYQFADWSQPGYYNKHMDAFKEAVQIQATPVTSYTKGDEITLDALTINSDLKFLGWYDNPEFTGSPVTKIKDSDSGDKVFYAKWEDEVIVESIIIDNEINEIERFTDYQLEWSFDPNNPHDERIEFSSSDENILIVTANGLLRALNEGTVTIRVKSSRNGVVKYMNIMVYSPDHFEASYETNSYVEIDEEIELNAKFNTKGSSDVELVWESLDTSIATVTSDGVVKGIKAGEVFIRVSVAGNSDQSFEFLVTVVDKGISEVLESILNAHESNIFTKHNLGIGAGKPVYYKDIFGSVNKFLFEDLTIDETFLARGNANTSGRGGEQESTEFITVHYTGNMSRGAGARANANYFVNNPLSIHYVTGNDGIFKALDHKYVAYHAGDGTGVRFTWTKTGVMAKADDPRYPVFGITKNSKFSINGEETTINVPTGDTTETKKVTDSRWINDQGLAFKVVDGEYYMGTTWWCYTQVAEGRICSKGGNNNSIGIESAVNEGTDLWFTWQRTAKLVAELMLELDLDITRVVGHHFFSAKDCPQPLLENDLEIWWEFIALVEAEYEILTKFNDYTFEFSSDSDLVDSTGRVTKQPKSAELITYTVKVTNGSTVQEITLGSVINGMYSK